MAQSGDLFENGAIEVFGAREHNLKDIDLKIKKCPKCKTADLIKRSGITKGRQWSFYGCSNYIYGCRYKEWAEK